MQLAQDDAYMEEIIETHKQLIYGIALTHTRNPFDAEDVFQQTFLTYYQKNKVFADAEHRKAWLIRTAINHARKITGSTWRKKTVPMAELPPESDFQFETPEENEVYQAVKSLPAHYKSVIYLFYFQQYTTEEIAGLLGIKPNAVRTRLSRGRALLREKLEGVYFG